MKSTVKQPSSNQFYAGLASSLKQKFNKHFNQYHRKYLLQKMKCYQKGPSGSTPASPQEYYACIESIQLEMKSNSQKLSERFMALDTEDRECQTVCKKSFDGEQLNDCISKCFSKYSENANKVYSQYYEQVLK